MDEILKTLAEHTGISVETARTALGAIVTYLKEHLPEGISGQLMHALPDSQALATSYEENKTETSGGILGVVAGLASKVIGGDASKLLAMLKSSGLDLAQIEAFVPKALELLKQHLPADLITKIEEAALGLITKKS